MDAPQHTETMDDLSALAWVQEELRRSLEAAHKLLRRHIKEVEASSGSDVSAVDPAVLRNARAQLHQGVGALELVGLPTAASVLRATEAAVQRCIGRPVLLNAKAVEAIEHASFALLDYLQRMLGGKPVSPLSLFPQYRAVQQLAGADRVHPADLWVMDWRWRELPKDASVRARTCDAEARGEVEQQMLTLMRSPSVDAAQRTSTIFAELAAGAREAQTATLWGLASGFFEAQALGLLVPDVYSKRVASRLLAQLRGVERGEAQPSERLAQDLLFFCAQCQSPRDAAQAPRLWAVRAAYGLQQSAPVDYEAARLGRFDPAQIAQARKRVAGAKDAWSAVAGGELHRLSGLNEQFSLVGDSLQRLFPQGDVLAQALHDAGARTVQAADAPPAALAMEVATGLLYVEAALEDAEFEDPAQGARVQRLAARIGAVAQGGTAESLEPWMEELYRRVSDRQTMGSVVQELRGSLSEVEKQIDAYFRNPADRALLIPVPGQLQAMRGVLSVLGMDQASLAVLRMRDEVDVLANTEVDPARAAQTFDRLAGNLGALGFLIDMLSVQPQTAKSLFVFDADHGTLSPVMGRQAKPSGFGALTLIEPVAAQPAPAPAAPPVVPALIEQVQSLAVAAASPEVPLETITLDLERLSQSALLSDQSVLAATVSTVQLALDNATDADSRHAVREELAQVMVDFVATASDASTLQPEIATLRATPVPPVPSAPLAPGATGLEEDDEMREIFLEEAREVMENAHAAMGVLADAPDNVGELTSVRRAFHTLKGSSRMVGLKDFGEAAWAFEQLYNARLADAPRADAPLMQLTLDALGYLGDWVGALAARHDRGHDARAVKAAADALRLEGRSLALPLPGQGAVLQPPAVAEPIEVPEVSEVPMAAPVASVVEEPIEPIDMPTLVLSEPIALPETVLELSLDLPSEPPVEPAPAAIDFELPAPSAEPVIEPLMPAPEVLELSFELDLSALDAAPAFVAPLATEALPELSMPAPVDAAPPEAANDDVDLEQVKVVGPLRIGIPLFNIFLNEADEQSRRLSTELAEWALELHRPVGETAVALAHSLAGNSATVGFADLSQLARSLEHALMRSQSRGRGDADEGRLFVEVADELRRLLHQFAAGFLHSPPPELLQRLAEHEFEAAHRVEWQTAEASDSGAMPLVAAESPPAVDLPVLTDEAAPVDFAPTTGFGHLEELKPLDELPAVETLEAHAEHARPDALDSADDIDAIDAVDAELFPIFEEEGQELVPQLASQVRDWLRRPGDPAGPTACMRTLHTLKGGARLAGAMRLGEMAHRLETNIEHLLARGDVHAADVETLQMRVDALASAFEALRSSDAQAYADASAQAAEALRAQLATPTVHAPLAELKAIEAIQPRLREAPAAAPIAAPSDDGTHPTGTDIDWSRFVGRAPTLANAPLAERATSLAAQAAVRVRAPLLDRLVNHAGEVSITRSRIESDVSQLKGSLSDLTENLERLRRQLRDIELQGETQISSRMEAAKAAAQAFDPLEMDRFTRFQELTRMMAESVNDVATVQRSLQRTLQSTEDELAAQARLTRDMQDDLLRTRMVEFEGMSERLYRVVRQAAKETGKHVRLDIVGGSIEIDRGVLDRMTGSFEHLLRNCLTHGIEMPEQRRAAGKDATGLIVVALTHEGNEVAIEFRDDGRGLDLLAIRDKAIGQGLVEAGKEYSDAELADLIFKPGFTTASSVTELAGRGIGMDVVRAEVNAMGGRIETATALGKGTSFKLVLPLTTAVTQVVMLRCGETTLAVPSTLVEIVRRAKPEEIAQCYANGTYTLGDVALPFFWLGALLQGSGRGSEGGRSLPVVVIRSAAQRIALHVDEVLGNQEVVVKNLGPQLARLPGLAGMTLLASGMVALIYNPVALATLYGDTARALMIEAQAKPHVEAGPVEAPVVLAPLVLVVDDSLTVRRVTQRMLVREGYRVSLAKDGLEALERLAEERPAVLLSDIEMPRMDGFDLVRNVRGDKQLADLPVIMITSRIAQKHRDVASELGVDHYLGKPYSEEDLLALVSRYAGAAVAM